MCSSIHGGSDTHFYLTGIPTIKHIQNINTKAHESKGVTSIQDQTVPATKEGGGHYAVERFRKLQGQGNENFSIGEHKIWFSDKTHL